MSAMQKYLHPNKLKLLSKGVKSVVSRVVNLQEFDPSINHDTMGEKIIEAFFNHHGTRCDVEELEVEEMRNIPELNKYYEQLVDENWFVGLSSFNCIIGDLDLQYQISRIRWKINLSGVYLMFI